MFDSIMGFLLMITMVFPVTLMILRTIYIVKNTDGIIDSLEQGGFNELAVRWRLFVNEGGKLPAPGTRAKNEYNACLTALKKIDFSASMDYLLSVQSTIRNFEKATILTILLIPIEVMIWLFVLWK